jgi:uncharacterized membrane protein
MINYIIITIFAIILASIHYYFNKWKNETVFIWFLTFIIFLIVSTLSTLEISVGMWIGLFAVLSILSFRKTFTTITLKYFLISISIAIVNAFLSYEWLFISIFILIVLFILEYYFLSNKNIRLKLKIELGVFKKDFSVKNITKIAFKEYGIFNIKKIKITEKYVIIKWIK